jgi:hypothetical protein
MAIGELWFVAKFKTSRIANERFPGVRKLACAFCTFIGIVTKAGARRLSQNSQASLFDGFLIWSAVRKRSLRAAFKWLLNNRL